METITLTFKIENFPKEMFEQSKEGAKYLTTKLKDPDLPVLTESMTVDFIDIKAIQSDHVTKLVASMFSFYLSATARKNSRRRNKN